MNGSEVNHNFEKFDVFEIAKRRECLGLFKMALEHLPMYDIHIDSQNEDGNTLLHLIIIYHQDRKLVQQLLSQGAKLDIKNNCQETALYLACASENLEIAKLLLEKGADINTKDTKSRSLLHIGVLKNNILLCKLLINSGIKLNYQDINGSTALHYAVELDNRKISILLLQKSDVNKQDFDGYTPLHIASRNSGDLVKLLLLKNASNSVKTHNGDLPLHLAASSGNLEAVTILLNRQIKINSVNNDNYTPLQLAEINAHKKIVELLNDYSTNFEPPSKIPRASRTRKSHGNVNSSRITIFPRSTIKL